MSQSKNKKLAIKSYQKQHGLHHKIDKKYGKVYWPYLPVLIFTLLGMSIGISLLAQGQNSKINTVSYASLLDSTNQYRRKNNLDQLNYSKELATAAQVQANQIAIVNSWSPLSISQVPAFNSITSATSLSSPAENLAYGFKSSNSIISAWSNSNYQNSNMLNSTANSVGYGIVDLPDFMNMKNQKIVVAIYADNKTIVSAIVPNANNKSGLNPNVQTLAIIKLNSVIKFSNVYELYILGGLMLTIAVIIFSKHTFLLHKWITAGEDLAIKHPLLDIALVTAFIVIAGALQTTGYIS
jgi:uncharacterized protein YkwD